SFFGESVTGMKLLFSALEFAALVLAWRLAAAWQLPLEPLVLWAWNPLFVFEFSDSGHSDSAMLFFALLALWLLEHGRASAAAAAHGLAVLSKLPPALWFPLLLRRMRPSAAAAAVAVVFGLGAVYFVRAPLGAYLWSLRLYYRLFEFNAGVHYLVVWIGREA